MKYTPDNIEPEDVGRLLEESRRTLDRLKEIQDMAWQAQHLLQPHVDIIARHFADPEPQEPGLDPAGEDGGLTWRISP